MGERDIFRKWILVNSLIELIIWVIDLFEKLMKILDFFYSNTYVCINIKVCIKLESVYENFVVYF